MDEGDARVRQHRIRLVGQPEERQRGPAQEVEVGMDGRELEVVRDAHGDAHGDADDEACGGDEQESRVDAKHGRRPLRWAAHCGALLLACEG
jgi:hypothetical protein